MAWAVPHAARAAEFSGASPSPRPRRRLVVGGAGGLDAPYAGQNALAVCRAAGVQVVRVSDEAIEEATRRVYADAKLACEPAGAAAVAAVLGGQIEGENVVAVVSGGNVGPENASAILAGS